MPNVFRFIDFWTWLCTFFKKTLSGTWISYSFFNTLKNLKTLKKLKKLNKIKGAKEKTAKVENFIIWNIKNLF